MVYVKTKSASALILTIRQYTIDIFRQRDGNIQICSYRRKVVYNIHAVTVFQAFTLFDSYQLSDKKRKKLIELWLVNSKTQANI